MKNKTLRVAVLGNTTYLKVYQQALSTVIKAMSEGATKIELITPRETILENALKAILADIARTVDLTVDFDDTAISTIISGEALKQAQLALVK